jgi:cell division protein FtsZ
MGISPSASSTKPFQFEGHRRMRLAEAGVNDCSMRRHADRHPEPEPVPGREREDHLRGRLRDGRPGLYSGVACITDLMVKEGLINLDFADVRAIMRGMGKAMMGRARRPARSAPTAQPRPPSRTRSSTTCR